MTQRAVVVLAIAAAIGLGACEHSQAFVPHEPEPNAPFGSPPVQLTFNAEGDWLPAFAPDGSTIGFSWRVAERTDNDRCIAFVPAVGGRVGRRVCRAGPHHEDSTNAASAHAVSPGGQIAVVFESSRIGTLAPANRDLWVGPVDGSDTLRVVRSFPYLTTNGLAATSAVDLHWLDEQTLVYLAQIVQYRAPVPGTPADTVDFGLEIAVLSLAGGQPSVTAVPGSLQATSVAVDQGTGIVYATWAADSHVYAVNLVSGQRQPVWDFGSLGVARDVSVSYGRLIAVTGGRTKLSDAPLYGVPLQSDEGGNVYVVDLSSGTQRVVVQDSSRLFRRAVLAPDGGRFVAESFAVNYVEHYIPNGPLASRDTIVAKASDLWLYDIP